MESKEIQQEKMRNWVSDEANQREIIRVTSMGRPISLLPHDEDDVWHLTDDEATAILQEYLPDFVAYVEGDHMYFFPKIKR